MAMPAQHTIPGGPWTIFILGIALASVTGLAIAVMVAMVMVMAVMAVMAMAEAASHSGFHTDFHRGITRITVIIHRGITRITVITLPGIVRTIAMAMVPEEGMGINPVAIMIAMSEMTAITAETVVVKVRTAMEIPVTAAMAIIRAAMEHHRSDAMYPLLHPDIQATRVW